MHKNGLDNYDYVKGRRLRRRCIQAIYAASNLE